MKQWLNSKGYYQGIFFLILMMLVSCSNDILTKYLGQRLSPFEMMFFRFLFNLLTLFPFIFIKGKSVLRTKMLSLNILRGVLGVIGFLLFIYSIIEIKLVEVVTIFWTIPLFVLVLSTVFLKEKVIASRWIATIIGFIGLSAVTLFDSGCELSFKFVYLLPIISAFVFSIQDVMIKKMVLVEEDRVTMLFYFALVATILSIIPAYMFWETPTLFELTMLFIIGTGGNLMQYLIFKAYNATDLSALSPFRYLEFCITAVLGFIFFSEIPGINVLIGAAILIPTTLYLSMTDKAR